MNPILIIAGLLAVFVLLVVVNAVRIVREYQRLVVFRLGRVIATKGPGIVFLIPFVDKAVTVDLREFFLEILFNKLQASKYWNETLLIITFDEHGGTYDHVEPPKGVMAPWTNPEDGTAPPTHYAVPFDFTRLGVRVPLLLISPLIE